MGLCNFSKQNTDKVTKVVLEISSFELLLVSFYTCTLLKLGKIIKNWYKKFGSNLI